MILLILAGIGISIALGENGLIDRTKTGGKKYQEESIKESINLAVLNSSVNSDLKLDKNILEGQLNKQLGEGKYTYTINEETGEVTVIYNEKEYKIATNGTKQDEEQDTKLYIIENGLSTNNFTMQNIRKISSCSNINDLRTIGETIQTGSRASINFPDIDLTGYSKIGIDYKVDSKTGNAQFSLHVFKNDANVLTESSIKYAKLLDDTDYSKTRTIDYLEEIPQGINKISVMKNATVNSTKVDFDIYNLWIEKTNGDKEYIIQNGKINYTYTENNASILCNTIEPNVFVLTDTTNSRASINLDNINLSEYSKIGIDYEVINKTGNAQFSLNVFKNDANVLTEDSIKHVKLLDETDYSKTRTIDYLEEIPQEINKISIMKNATGNNTYIQYKIYNLWLEK